MDAAGVVVLLFPNKLPEAGVFILFPKSDPWVEEDGLPENNEFIWLSFCWLGIVIRFWTDKKQKQEWKIRKLN